MREVNRKCLIMNTKFKPKKMPVSRSREIQVAATQIFARILGNKDR